MKILIADDNEENRYMLQALLKGAGHEVFSAHDGIEALDILKSSGAELIISDILMPKMDGFQLCRAVRGDEDLRNIPFVFYTATYISDKDRDFALSLGADLFFVKPDDMEVLVQTIRNVIPAHPSAVEYPLGDEMEFFRQHNTVLFRKLEKKIADLEGAKEKLQTSLQQMSAILNNIPDIAWLKDTESRFIAVNAPFGETCGRNPQDIVGKTDMDIWPQDLANLYRLDDQDVMRTKQRKRVEERLVGSDGKETWLETIKTPVFNLDGNIIGTTGIARDITERKQLELSLKEEKAFTENALNGLRDIFFVFDLEGRFLRWNKAVDRVLGYKDGEITSMKPVDFFGEGDADRIKAAIQKAVKDGSVSIEAEVVTKDRQKIPSEITGSLLKDTKGNPIGISGVSRDITARKRAEERIYGQIQKLSALRSIDLAISSTMDIRVTLKIYIEHVITQLGVDAANVLLLNPHTRRLEYTASQGFRTSALKHRHLCLGEGYAGVAALENRIVSIPNLKDEGTSFSRLGLLEGEDFLTYYGVPLVSKGHVKGVLEIFHRRPLKPDEEWFEFLDALALQAAIAIDNSSLFYNLERSNMDLMLAYDNTIEGWSRALDYRDKETEGHSQRVTEMTLKISREMGMNEEALVNVRRGALLHDIGKMGIPDNILLKPGPLTEDEWKIMRLHPVYSYELLYPIAYLRPALDIPYCHHEKWDGTGYPRGLKEEQIPLPARIFAVVDVWDALRSDRPYRPAWTEKKTIEYIRSLSGIQFEPKVVEACLRAIAAKKD